MGAIRNRSRRSDIRRATAAVLIFCMLMPSGVGTTDVLASGREEEREITEFAELPESVKRQTVPLGTQEEDLRLPRTISVTYAVPGEDATEGNTGTSGGKASQSETDDGNRTASGSQLNGTDREPASSSEILPKMHVGGGRRTKKIAVTWESFPDYDASREREYTFTPVLPDGYVEGDGVLLPEIEITLERELPRAVKDLMEQIDALPSVDSIYETMSGDADPEFAEWLSGMRETIRAVRAAGAAYESLSAQEREQLPSAYTDQLTDLLSLVERLEEMGILEYSENWSDHAASAFEEGNGSKAQPYEIKTPEQLAYFAKQSTADTKNRYYKLTADIDLDGHYWNPSASAFCGNFDGNGRTIRNMLCVQSTGYGKGGGLFGEIDGTNAADGNLKIQGITFEDCTVKDDPEESHKFRSGAGILAGYVGPKVDITDCHVRDSEVTVTGDTYSVGGLVGYVGYYSKPSAASAVGQKIENCSVSSTQVSNKTYGIGGLVGQAYYGIESIKNCVLEDISVKTKGVQYNGALAGGLVGYLQTGSVECEISDCKVTGTGSVSADDEKFGFYIGGLIGEIKFNDRKKSTKLLRCTSESEVLSEATENGWVGGLVGIANNARSWNGTVYFSMEDCHASGDVTGRSKCVGGLVGSLMGNLKDCTASGDVTGYYQVGGLVGSLEGSGDNPPAEISGCHATGTVTGEQGDKDSASEAVGGLVGYVDAVVLTDSYATGEVSGDGGSYGGLIGMSDGSSLTRCYAKGAVNTPGWNVGGLIGSSYSSKIAECYAEGAVTASDWQVGGLTGYSGSDTIENSYATGTVRSEAAEIEPRVGGLIGNGNGSTVKNCYSGQRVTAADPDEGTLAGFIGCSVDESGNTKLTVENCSYDRETSGQEQGIGISADDSSISLKAEKTADMKHPNQAYYLNAGGRNQVWGWKKGENSDYPYLGEPKITDKKSREAYLSSLTVSDRAPEPGILTPDFERDTLSYRLQTEGDNIEIRAVAADRAKMKIRGAAGEQEFTGESVQTLAVGENLIYIDVTAEDELTVRTYTLTVTRTEVEATSGILKGIVTAGGAPVAGVKVEVRLGGPDGALVDETLTAQDGSYRFADLEYGVYGVVVLAEDGGKRAAETVETDSEETVLHIALPEGDKNTVVESGGTDTPPLTASGLETLFEENSLAEEDEKGYTREDQEVVESGGSVEIKLRGELRLSSELGPEEDALKEAAGGRELSLIMDFTVLKTVWDDSGTELKQIYLKELPRQIHIVLPIPEELKGQGRIKVYRIHDGQTEELPEGASAGEEYFAVRGDEIHLYVNKFSLYVFVGGDKKPEEENPGEEKPAEPSGGASASRDRGPQGTWVKDGTGWIYRYTELRRAYGGWYYLFWNGRYAWYHFDGRGYMDTGWFLDVDGKQYYLHPVSDGGQGYMYTGWNLIDGRWYYFEPQAGRGQGQLYKDTVTPDGYRVDENGEWVRSVQALPLVRWKGIK